MGYVYLIAAAAFAAAAFAGGWGARGVRADATEAKLRADHASVVSAWDRAAVESSEAQRAEERRRVAAVTQEAEDARRDAALDAKRAADLRGANQRLLDHVARLAVYADRACRDAPAAAGGAATAGPGLVLADLYRSADAEATELAAFFDAARRAGLACERTYDAVRENGP